MFRVYATLLFACLMVAPVSGQEESAPTPQVSELVAEPAQADIIRDVLVPVREAGILQRLLVKEGDWVIVDQPIAELDRELNELEVQAAEKKYELSKTKATDDVDLRYSTKSEEVAEATLARSESAVQNYAKSISKTELDQLRLELQRASLSIEKAQFEQKLAGIETELYTNEAAVARLKLRYRTINSPIEGMVVELIAQEGEFVNVGQPLVRIVQLDRMRIKALLRADQINQSFLGRKAIFETKADGSRFEGTIHFVSPEIMPGNEKVQFWFDVDNPDRKLRKREDGTVRILLN
jgi:macrolide-specific efflux system membrane fusion protein